MREITLREFQIAELDILKRIDEICAKQNLRYWIMYGTLLGAIRHKGFIPWDDDIDVAMPRADYERFIQYVRENPEEMRPLEIEAYDKTVGYPFYIARLCNQNYLLTFEERAYTSGLFVDLYPFDGMGNAKQYWHHKHPELLKIRKHLTLSSWNSLFYGRGIGHKIGNFPNAVYSRLRGNVYFLKQLDRIEQQFTWEESRYVSVPAWDPDVWFFEKEWFDELIRVPFEDIEVNIPARYDEILKERYGDYMQLPPEDQRKPHKEFRAFLKE
ncbi:MAG: LicD family protein [Eubacterium sp.]|nr:LicD family protein [Eubacterium sp.]